MLTATKRRIVDIDRDQEDYPNNTFGYDRAYQREAQETPSGYREHLYESLQGRSKAIGYNEYEDNTRYDNMSYDLRYNRKSKANFQSRTNEKEKKARVFKKKLIPFVACYFLMVAVIVALIVVNIQGTAWEKEGITVNAGSVITPETASASQSGSTIASYNQIVTQSGVVSVELSPYPEKNTYEQDTNWFDRLCDWISNLAGG